MLRCTCELVLLRKTHRRDHWPAALQNTSVGVHKCRQHRSTYDLFVQNRHGHLLFDASRIHVHLDGNRRRHVWSVQIETGRNDLLQSASFSTWRSSRCALQHIFQSYRLIPRSQICIRIDFYFVLKRSFHMLWYFCRKVSRLVFVSI